MNLEDPQTGRRYSIVLSEEDFGPRTLLADALPPLKGGESVSLRLDGLPAPYDPSLPEESFNLRWHQLVAEWEGLLEGDLEDLAAPARGRDFGALLGLGPGSTPAGDDFLAGYAVGNRWLTPSSPRKPAWTELLDLARTTWLSGEILKDAMRGLVWKRSRDLLSALASDDPSAVTGAAGSILSWGHSSGRAWLAGLSAAVVDVLKCMKGG